MTDDVTENKGIAQELADDQRSISISEFVEKNKHMLGFDSKGRSLITAVKEGVDNSLDAAEEARILPEINVSIEENGKYYDLIIEDNGPGLPEDNINKVFGKLLYGSRFGKNKQSRGQQGIGISAAVLYSQITSGEPAKITSKVKKEENARYVELMLNTDTNEPEIKHSEEINWGNKEHGTKIKLTLDVNMRARSSLHNYIKYTAVVNPHARITLSEPENEFEFKRVTDKLPRQPEEIKPHPHGIALGDLINMIEETETYSMKSFLKKEFTKVGNTKAEQILDNYRDKYYGKNFSWETETSYDIEEMVEKIELDNSNEIVNSLRENFKEEINFTILENTINETDISDEQKQELINVIWEQIKETEKYTYVKNLIDEATSTRKNEETIKILSENLTENINEYNDKYRLTPSELREIIDKSSDETEKQVDESIGETARMNIYDAIEKNMETVNKEISNVDDFINNREKCSALLKAMQETSVHRPSDKALSPIEPDLIEEGLKKEYDAEFYDSSQRNASVHNGSPFIVEAGIAYGGEIEKQGKIELLRFANRVPLVYQRGAGSISDVIKNIRWKNYKLKQSGDYGIPEGQAVILVHIASTNVPFTSESKDAVASVPELEHEIEQAVREVGRSLKKHLKKKRSLNKRRQKSKTVTKLLPEIAEKASNVAGKDTPSIEDSLAKIMNNVLLQIKEEDENTFIKVKNFSNKKESLKIVKDSENDNEQSEYSLTLDKGDEEKIETDITKDSIENIEIRNLEEEKYNII